MLDQAYSVHNFEVIFDLENRKGNIDIDWMPEEYLDAVAKMKSFRKRIVELKGKGQNKSEDDLKELNKLAEDFKIEKLKKENSRKAFLVACDHKINSKNFVIKMKKFLDKDSGKEVFTLNLEDPAVFFAIKQLQYNIRKTFKVKQANRHSILCDIKSLLHTRVPLYIVRTDISSFYESISQKALLEKIEGNTLLSHKSKAIIRAILKLYEGCKDSTLVNYGVGLPRGIGISSLLSEIYVRDLDSCIKSFMGTLYYARYVDDIFVALTSLPSGCNDVKGYFSIMQTKFGNCGLTLKDDKDLKGKGIMMDFTDSDKSYSPFDYLGYSIAIERKNRQMSVSFGLSNNKKIHFKEKVDHIVAHFENKSKYNIKEAYRDLFDSLNYITANTKLFKSKAGVKVGLYYNNDLLDKKEDLNDLQRYLRTKKIVPSHTATGWTKCKDKIARKLANIDFCKRWEQKKMFYFSLARIQEIEKWL